MKWIQVIKPSHSSFVGRLYISFHAVQRFSFTQIQRVWHTDASVQYSLYARVKITSTNFTYSLSISAYVCFLARPLYH